MRENPALYDVWTRFLWGAGSGAGCGASREVGLRIHRVPRQMQLPTKIMQTNSINSSGMHTTASCSS